MKIALLIVASIGLLTLTWLFILSPSKSLTQPKTSPVPSSQTQKTVEAKAAFAIFTNGTLRIFTAAMYHNQSSDVFIEAPNPNIINVKKQGLTWSDFFETLPMSLKKDCLVTGTKQTFCTNETARLRFFINGQEDPDALDRQIKDGNKLLVSYGNKTKEEINKELEQIPNPNE
jgi:hypothetical protein